ncbi:MAG: hypothetical protein RL519_221 [Pseudomonadota bacterium]|jgi:hypothetical protein
MAVIALRRDEGLALLAAIVAHIGLVVVLTLQPTPIPLPPPERITVTLSDEVGLTSTSPSTAPAAADEAPDLGEDATPPSPAPVARPDPLPKPVARATVTPLPKPAPLAKAPPAKAVTPAPKALPAKTASKPGASRIGDDFLKGTPGGTAKASPGPPPAATIGPAVRSALSSAILRQIKPKWQGRVPQGVETEKLVTIISIELDQQGNLIGSPRVLGQEGITDSNRSQAKRHAEEAVKALQLAAPFNLPAEYYEAWRRPPPIRMRKSL